MNDLSENSELKYKALAQAAMAAIQGQPVEKIAEAGLAPAIEYMGLAAGALILWDKRGDIIVKAVVADRDEDKDILLDMENSFLAMLRSSHKLTTAYMELGGDPPKSVCTIPIPMEEFDNKISAVRNEGVLQLARAINHHMNNALTVISNEPQLILKNNPDLSTSIQKKLKNIKDKTDDMQDVVMRAREAPEYPAVEYLDDIKMTGLYEKKKEAIIGRQFGTFIGIKTGPGLLHGYDDFLQSLTAVLAIATVPDIAKRNAETEDKRQEGKDGTDEKGKA